jgi:hypothetical protein
LIKRSLPSPPEGYQQWDEALDLNAAIMASMRARHAPASDITIARFNDHGPLLRLGRLDEALDLLLDCRDVFDDDHNARMLGKTLTDLAAVEDIRGHSKAAVLLERDALRYAYITGDVTSISASYHNIGNLLAGQAREFAPALACHLSAALIEALTGGRGLGDLVANAALDLRASGTPVVPPADMADLCRRVGDIPGTDLHRLIAQLSPDPETAERTLRDLIARAAAMAAQSPAP